MSSIFIIHFYSFPYISHEKVYQIIKGVKSLIRFCHRDDDQPFQTTQKVYSKTAAVSMFHKFNGKILHILSTFYHKLDSMFKFRRKLPKKLNQLVCSIKIVFSGRKKCENIYHDLNKCPNLVVILPHPVSVKWKVFGHFQIHLTVYSDHQSFDHISQFQNFNDQLNGAFSGAFQIRASVYCVYSVENLRAPIRG